MSRDDDLRNLFRDMADRVESGVSRPPARKIMQRAGLGPARQPKPFPIIGIVGVGALPFVAVGAVLVYPAAAEQFFGQREVSMPSASTVTASTSTGTSAPAPSSAATSPSPSATGASAVTPLENVAVVFTDERVPGDGCRRATSADRLVDPGDPVTGALDGLLAGPMPEEAAAGLSSPLIPGAAELTVDPDTSTVTVSVADSGDWRDACGPEEFGLALGRTVSQFEGWSAVLLVEGTPVDTVVMDEGVEDGVGPGTEASAETASAAASSGASADPGPGSVQSDG
jgi:hypothetical protein